MASSSRAIARPSSPRLNRCTARSWRRRARSAASVESWKGSSTTSAGVVVPSARVTVSTVPGVRWARSDVGQGHRPLPGHRQGARGPGAQLAALGVAEGLAGGGERGQRVARQLAEDESPQGLGHRAVGADAGHHLLAQVAALRIADGAVLQPGLGQHAAAGGQVRAQQRPAGLDPQPVPGGFRRVVRIRTKQGKRQVERGAPGHQPQVSRIAGERARDGEAGGLGAARRTPAARGRVRSLHHRPVELRRNVLQQHVLADHEALQVGQQPGDLRPRQQRQVGGEGLTLVRQPMQAEPGHQRTLAVQARRQLARAPGASAATSLVSWACRKVPPSAPATSRAPSAGAPFQSQPRPVARARRHSSRAAALIRRSSPRTRRCWWRWDC